MTYDLNFQLDMKAVSNETKVKLNENWKTTIKKKTNRSIDF